MQLCCWYEREKEMIVREKSVKGMIGGKKRMKIQLDMEYCGLNYNKNK
jgi:hypothetical protein